MNNKALPILLIEDNAADAVLVREFLNEASVRHDLFHADTLFEGIEIIRDRGDVQMILLDLTLPDSAGFRTLTSLLEKVSGIPVIVMTGINNEIVGNQAVKAGAQDFLVKGQFDGKLLGRSIRYAQQRFREQQKQTEALIQLSSIEKRFLEAEEMGHFGNWQMDVVSNQMTWTDQVYRIFGVQPRSVQASMTQYLNFTHPEDRADIDQFFENAQRDGQQHRIEHRILINGTTIRHLATSARVGFDEATGRMHLSGVVQDITERRVAELLMIERNLTNRSSKMKEEVLADMSFHIRTPLSSIVNLLFLLDNTAISNQQKELLEGLRTSVDDLSIIINNLLNLSILSTENMKIEEEQFGFRDFLQSIRKLVQIKADSVGVHIEYEVGKDIPEKLIGDNRKLTQILYNLLHNAIRLSEKKSLIALEINARETEGRGLDLLFVIKDNGKSMPASRIKELLHADNLLKMYTETDSSNEERMHEIGLAIVAKLVKTLEGKFEIHSKEGVGTTYRFEVPVKAAKIVRPKAGDVPEGPLRLLLVEDHFLNQIATKKVLTAWSDFVSVDIAENGLVGVEKYREHGYDLILMDIQMPVMNGIESARRIREKSEVPIVALTANSSRLEMEKCFEVGMNDYLAKPFKPQDLYAKIMSLLVTTT